jgi:hypothetical protein
VASTIHQFPPDGELAARDGLVGHRLEVLDDGHRGVVAPVETVSNFESSPTN